MIGAAALCLTAVAGPAVATAAPGPVVTSLSSTSGPVGGHGRLTVHGSGFTGVTRVLFGGARAGSVHVVSSHSLTLVVPAHKAGRVAVRVVTGHGESAANKHDVFTYVAAPVVSSVSPGSALADVKVTVRGANFLHVRKVLFGKAVGTRVHVVSSKVLTVVAPAHPAGRVDVRVQSAYGTSPVKPVDRFSFVAPTVTPPPVVPNPVITTTSLPNAERGQPYSAAVTAGSGRPPYTVTGTGLPAGISLSAAGALSGRTFAPVGPYRAVVTVTDALGHSASAPLTLTVTPHAGQVYAWGDNNYGEVGNGARDATPVTSPVALPALTGVVQVVASGAAGYAVRADGTVYSWGSNDYGQLGNGSTTAQYSPQQVAGVTGVVSMAAAAYTAYALRSDGTVLAWGHNTEGELGDGTTTDRLLPQPVPGLSGVVQLAAGYYTAYALTADGHVWSWGENTAGQLGTGTGATSVPTPTLLSGVSGVRQLAAKGATVHALLADGTVVGWGDNQYGEVGDTTTTTRTTPVPVYGLAHVTALAAANGAAFALLADGTVRAWGQNDGGELGDGTTTVRLSPQPIPGLTGVVSVDAAAYNGFATSADGTVRAWGWGTWGDNADGTTSNRPSPATSPALQGMTDLDGRGGAYGIR